MKQPTTGTGSDEVSDLVEFTVSVHPSNLEKLEGARAKELEIDWRSAPREICLEWSGNEAPALEMFECGLVSDAARPRETLLARCMRRARSAQSLVRRPAQILRS